MMEGFVHKDPIVREIWGKSDTILLIFAGAAAEFALNKAVDWLYFTGRLPADPLGRLFSTVSYARKIVFSDERSAHKAIDSITAIHRGVEQARGAKIPDWAYRDVLFMLIDYSIRSFELLEHKLSVDEKAEVFDVFNRVGHRMNLVGLPENFNTWQTMRQNHMQNDLQYGVYTIDLFRQYRKHLGAIRYRILLESQALVVPDDIARLLKFRKTSLFAPLLRIYKISRPVGIGDLLKALLLPPKYQAEIRGLDIKSKKKAGRSGSKIDA